MKDDQPIMEHVPAWDIRWPRGLEPSVSVSAVGIESTKQAIYRVLQAVNQSGLAAPLSQNQMEIVSASVAESTLPWVNVAVFTPN